MNFRLINTLILGACVFLTAPAFASSIEVVVASSDAGKETAGRFSYSVDSAGMDIVYHDSASNKERKYHQAKFDECSSMALYPLSAKGQIAIDGSCSSRGGQVFTHIYEWNKKLETGALSGRLLGKNRIFPRVTCSALARLQEWWDARESEMTDRISMKKNLG